VTFLSQDDDKCCAECKICRSSFFGRDFQRNRFVSCGAATTGPAVDTLVSKLLRSILLASFYWEISSKEKCSM
jgi:hypothetical protein